MATELLYWETVDSGGNLRNTPRGIEPANEGWLHRHAFHRANSLERSRQKQHTQ